MCFGFLGVQFAFGLQNANVSRIFQSLGASLDQVPLLWIAAPLSGRHMLESVSGAQVVGLPPMSGLIAQQR